MCKALGLNVYNIFCEIFRLPRRGHPNTMNRAQLVSYEGRCFAVPYCIVMVWGDARVAETGSGLELSPSVCDTPGLVSSMTKKKIRSV